MPRPQLGEYGHVVPRPAATVLLLRDGPRGPEVLLSHRPTTMAFAPDLHVFPGGAVDPVDSSPRLAARSRLPPAEAARRLGGAIDPTRALALHVAAIRELFEEAGVLFAAPRTSRGARPAALEAARRALVHEALGFDELCEDLDVVLATDRLVPLSRWVTPAALPRRFDAWFFGAVMPSGVEPTVEGHEIVAHHWMRPVDALDGLAEGSLRMWMPTSSNLQRLERLATSADLGRLAVETAGVPETVRAAPDILRVVMPSGAGVDGLEVNGYLVGGGELVAVDPGDPSEEALLQLVEAATAEEATIATVALTSPDPDHVGGAEHLREGLGVLVHGGRGSGRPLPFEVVELDDGVRVPGGDVRLHVVETPGPRPEHVAYLVPGSRSVLVGDLLGGPPALVIAGPTDPVAWRSSLTRVRALEPARLLPAHGDPIEGGPAVGAAIDEALVRLG